MRGPGYERKALTRLLLSFGVVPLALLACAPLTLAESPREAVANELLATNQTLTPLMESVAKCLQERGMWPASGPTAQMCRQMQMFRQNLVMVGMENRKRMPYLLLRSKMQVLEQAATMIEGWLSSMQPTEEIAQRWGETKAAFIRANKAFYAGASSPGWERHYDADVPDSSYHRGEGMKYYVRVTGRENTELCRSVQAFLEAKGRWSPQGADLELCAALKMLTMQLEKLAATEGEGCEAEAQIVEISANRKIIERLIADAGLNQVAAKDWFEVRTGLSDIMQAFCKQCPAAKQLGLDAEEESAPATTGAGQAQEQPASEQPNQPAPEESQF